MKTKAISAIVVAVVSLTATAEDLIYDDFVADSCCGVSCWNVSPEDNCVSRRQLTILPELAPGGKHVLHVSDANSLRMGNNIRLVPGGKYRLSIKVRSHGLKNMRHLQYLIYGFDGWHKSWCMDLPKDTGGKWQEVSKDVTLLAEGSGNCTLCLYADRPFADGAFLDLAHPRLEALDEKAIAGSERKLQLPAPLVPRITPVDPILSEVRADAAKFTFLFPGDVANADEKFVLRARLQGRTATGAFDADRRASVDFGAITPGRHGIALAVVGEKSGRVVASNDYTIVTLVTAENATPLKRLNNFVSEIWTKPLRNGAYEFTIEKAGWVYVKLDRPYPTVTASIDGVPAIRYRHREPSETQRYLSAGKHRISVRGAQGEQEKGTSGEAAKGTISVRLVKTISMSGYKHIINPNGDYSRWGYSLAYYHLFNLFSTPNTVQVNDSVMSSPRAAPVKFEFEDRGFKVIASGGPSSAHVSRDAVGTLVAAVAKNGAFVKNVPMAIDENAIAAPPLMKYNYSEAAWILGRTNEEIHVWFADGSTVLFNRPIFDTMEVSAIINSGAARGQMFTEAYYRTPKDEAGQTALEDWIRLQMETLRRCVPAAPSRYIYALSGWEFPGCYITAARPDVDLKAFYARILRMLATDPTFRDVGGVGMTTPICNEDLFRFSFDLIRHYCLDGATDDYGELLGMKLFPNHLQNGDFDHGFDSWTAEPAAEGSLAVVDKPGFSARYEKRVRSAESKDAGARYAQMTVSAKRPNRLCQTLKGLNPGGLYQIYFVSMDAADFAKPGVSKLLKAVIGCRVTGAEEIRDLDHVVKMRVKGKGKGRPGVFVHRRVFRATAETAELELSDWGEDGRPAGEVGSRHAFHFVGCDPFFVRDDVDLANIRALNRGNNLR